MRISYLLLCTATLAFQACGGCPTDNPGLDFDGDGFQVLSLTCAQEGVALPGPTDCDDDDPLVFPGADERCNGLDNDCNGVVDDGTPVEGPDAWTDVDRDGFGGGEPFIACALQPGIVRKGEDCDDNNPSANPNEVDADHCDNVDMDCDGSVEGRVGINGDKTAQTIAEAFVTSPVAAELHLCEGEFELVDYQGNLTIEGTCSESTCTSLSSSGVTLGGSEIELKDLSIVPAEAGPGLTLTPTDLHVDNVIFERHSGTAMQLDLASGEAIIEGSSFASNASESGGALAVRMSEGTKLEISNSTFSQNAATASGGAIWVRAGSQGTILLNNVDLTNNAAGEHGGAIAHADGVTTRLVLDRVRANNNVADGHGGAIHANTTVDLTQLEARDNTSALQGGTARLAGTTSMTSVVIHSGKATQGGGLWLAGSAAGRLVRIDTSTATEGGGLYVAEGAGVTINTLALANNEATEGGGGAIHGNLSSDGCDVSDNEAEVGAGLYVSGTMSASQCVLKNNVATVSAGAMYLSGTATMTGPTTQDNTAPRGAGFEVSGRLICSKGLQNGLFSGNTATVIGGAMLIRDKGRLDSTSCTLEHNQAPLGAAIGFSAGSDALVDATGSLLTGNKGSPAFGGEATSAADLRIKLGKFFKHAGGVFDLGADHKLDCVDCNWGDKDQPNAFSVRIPSGTLYKWEHLRDAVCNDAGCLE